MNTEDQARAAMRAIASTVHGAPPLDLRPARQRRRAPDQISFADDQPTEESVLGRGRRWRAWAAPVTAAAAVAVLLVTLGVVKGFGNGNGNSANTATSTNSAPAGSIAPAGRETTDSATSAGPGGAPRYYAAIQEILPTASQFKAELATGAEFPQDVISVGDSVNGRTLAAFKSPGNTVFVSVNAASDDRTFAVLAVTDSKPWNISLKGDTLTASWYRLTITPGAADPVRLTRMPVKPMAWAGSDDIYTNPEPGEVIDTSLSGSGQELAVADIPATASDKPQDGQEVEVFSVATGKLLHDWTENDPAADWQNVLTGSLAGVPDGNSTVTWVDGDRALDVATAEHVNDNLSTGTVRQLDVAGGPASGSLQQDSTLVWTGSLSWNDGSCYALSSWPPQISGDGNAVSCLDVDQPANNNLPGKITFGTGPLRAGVSDAVSPTVACTAQLAPERKTHGVTTGIMWMSASGQKLIVSWKPDGGKDDVQHFGLVSQGKFTPLKVPNNLTGLIGNSVSSTFVGMAF